MKTKRDQGYDYLAKLLIVGDSGVGKTNILLRFCENNFMGSHLTTIGKSFLKQELTLKSRPSLLKARICGYKYGILPARKGSRQ